MTRADAQKQVAALYANESSADPPRDNLVRSMPVEIRDDTPDGMLGTLAGHFSTFGDWYEVDSVREGHFLERVAPGAFRKTFAENRNGMRVTFNHGQDPSLGDKVIGPIADLREDDVGAYYEVPILDTSYNRDLVPGLRAGQYGASFRFSVVRHQFERNTEPSDHNPEALPERTLQELRVHEFGPVTYPASPTATAAVRSLTDQYLMRQLPTMTVAVAPPIPDAATPPEVKPPAERMTPVAETTPITRAEMAARETELKDVLARLADEYPGELPSGAQAEWDKADNEIKQLQRDMAAWDTRRARIAELATSEHNVVVPDVLERPAPQIMRSYSQRDIYDTAEIDRQGGSLEDRQQRWRDFAMRAVETSSYSPIADVPATQAKVQRFLDSDDSPAATETARRVLLTGSPLYRKVYNKFLKSGGNPMYLTPEEQRGTALAVGVDGTGGFTVPFAFDPTVIAIGSWTGAVNPYRRSCRVVQIAGTDTWNALTSTAVVATRTTEAAAATEQGPTFAQPQYIVTRVQGQITASFEMFQDRADLASEMSTLIQEAKDNEEENKFAVGAGASQDPIGVGPVNGTSGAYTSITTATSVTLAAADADATEAALPVRHRFNAQWFLNRLSVRRFQSLETTGGKLFGGSQYPAVGNVLRDRAGNTGLTLLGYPVNESPSLPTAQTANIVIGTLLNVDSYVIVDRIGMQVQFIPFIFNSSALATGQQALYFMWRNFAKPINVDAGRTLRYLT